jgi:steroid 5-alpha reductase family enzyme
LGFSISGNPFVFLSPILITYLLLYVSGIPMLEKRFTGNPEWETYKARTSAFVPMPPKQDA